MINYLKQCNAQVEFLCLLFSCIQKLARDGGQEVSEDEDEDYEEDDEDEDEEDDDDEDDNDNDDDESDNDDAGNERETQQNTENTELDEGQLT